MTAPDAGVVDADTILILERRFPAGQFDAIGEDRIKAVMRVEFDQALMKVLSADKTAFFVGPVETAVRWESQTIGSFQGIAVVTMKRTVIEKR